MRFLLDLEESDLTPLPKKWLQTERMAFLYKEIDGCFYRAQNVKSVVTDDSLEIYLVDTGETMKTSIQNLFVMPQDVFRASKMLAIPVGIRLTKIESEILDNFAGEIKNLISGLVKDRCIFIKISGAAENLADRISYECKAHTTATLKEVYVAVDIILSRTDEGEFSLLSELKNFINSKSPQKTPLGCIEEESEYESPISSSSTLHNYEQVDGLTVEETAENIIESKENCCVRIVHFLDSLAFVNHEIITLKLGEKFYISFESISDIFESARESGPQFATELTNHEVVLLKSSELKTEIQDRRFFTISSLSNMFDKCCIEKTYLHDDLLITLAQSEKLELTSSSSTFDMESASQIGESMSLTFENIIENYERKIQTLKVDPAASEKLHCRVG